jgi:hypothetical protein
MSFQLTPIQITIVAVVLLLVVAIAVGLYLKHRKTRTLGFKNRFGSEYDRAVQQHGTPKKAEAKLADRENRVEKMKIRELSPTERERFVGEWQTVQSRFVDHPKSAVVEADDLINSLLEARGYPKDGFEQRAADVSVTYPRLMENYRVGHDIAVRPGNADASTEELRTAMIQYRAIFDELVQVQAPGQVRTAA